MDLLEYYLTGGKLRLGKKEFALELLRKDSILRTLLGYGAGELKSLATKPVHGDTQEDFVILDFSTTGERQISGEPNGMLKELKQRYGEALSGKLYFRAVYTTFVHVTYFEVDLNA